MPMIDTTRFRDKPGMTDIVEAAVTSADPTAVRAGSTDKDNDINEIGTYYIFSQKNESTQKP